MDTVFADAPAGHNDTITRQGLFDMTRLTVQRGRHQSRRTAIDQWLAGKAIVKNDGTVDSRDSTLISAMLNTLDHTFKNTARMKQSGRQRMSIKRGSEAEHVGIEH